MPQKRGARSEVPATPAAITRGAPSPYERTVADRLSFYGFQSEDELGSPQADKTMKDCGMIGWISADDPPVALACGQPGGEPNDRGHYVHHPKHSVAIAERCKAAGVPCKLLLRDETQGDRGNFEQDVVAFVIEKLKTAQ